MPRSKKLVPPPPPPMPTPEERKLTAATARDAQLLLNVLLSNVGEGRLNLTVRDIAVLILLEFGRVEGSVRVLATALNVHRQAISRCAIQLELLRLTVREKGQVDKRDVVLKLTDTGRDTITQLVQAMRTKPEVLEQIEEEAKQAGRERARISALAAQVVEHAAT